MVRPVIAIPLSPQHSILSTFYHDEQLTVLDLAQSGGGAA